MSIHHAIPACSVPKAPKTKGTMHLRPTLPHAAYLHPQVAILCQILSMVPTDVPIGRTADVNKKTTVSRPVGWLCSGDGPITTMSSVSISLSG